MKRTYLVASAIEMTVHCRDALVLRPGDVLDELLPGRAGERLLRRKIRSVVQSDLAGRRRSQVEFDGRDRREKVMWRRMLGKSGEISSVRSRVGDQRKVERTTNSYLLLSSSCTDVASVIGSERRIRGS